MLFKNSTHKHLLLFVVLFNFGCQHQKNGLTNTKWVVVDIKLDTINSTSNIEKGAINTFHESAKLYSEFKDTVMLIHSEGKEIIKSEYLLKDDTLFFNDNYTRDTNIVLKLSVDSLILRNSQRIKIWLVRLK